MKLQRDGDEACVISVRYESSRVMPSRGYTKGKSNSSCFPMTSSLGGFAFIFEFIVTLLNLTLAVLEPCLS
jgi:hypothetical protein